MDGLLRERIKAAILRHGGKKDYIIAHRVRIKGGGHASSDQVREVRELMESGKPECSAKPETQLRRSLTEFKKLYDKDTIVPEKIRVSLLVLGDGGWLYEVEFCKLAGVSMSDMSTYRQQFMEYVVLLKKDGRRVWAGTVETANAIREMI